MGKKIEPRAGWTGAVRLGPAGQPALDEDALNTLRARHFSDLEDANWGAVGAELEEAARAYLVFKHRDSGPTPAEVRAACDQLLSSASDLWDGLENLDEKTASTIMLRLFEVGSPLNLDRFRNDLRALRSALVISRPTQRKRGPRQAPALVMVRLADSYERHTGKRFTRRFKIEDEYGRRIRPEPESPAARFVCDFFKIVDPEITAWTVHDEMMRFIASRREVRSERGK